jgi:transcriptional regulator with XRE-family HTH domain
MERVIVGWRSPAIARNSQLRYIARMQRSQLRTPLNARAAASSPRRKTGPARKAADYKGGTWGYAVAERLRLLMTGASIRRFADRVGVSGSLVSSYLSGGRLPEAGTLHRIAERTGVSLDWLLCGEGGADVRYRGQSRTRAELAEDVAAFVRRGVSERLGDAHPNLAPDVDGQRVLDRVTHLAARSYRGWADRIAAISEALMPVTELSLHATSLTETLAGFVTPIAQSEIRSRTGECVDRAWDAVFSLPRKVEAAARYRPSQFFPTPTAADFEDISTRRATAVMKPWVPPEDRVQPPATASKRKRRQRT